MKYIVSLFLFVIGIFANAQSQQNVVVHQKQSAEKMQNSLNQLLISSNDANWVKKVQDAFDKHLNSTNLFDTLFIILKEGDYPITNSLQLHLIRGEGKVVISGGITLNNLHFKPLTNQTIIERIIDKQAQKEILEYDLKAAGINHLGTLNCIGFGRTAGIAPAQLFYNGERMTLARYPNQVNRTELKNRQSVIPIKKIINPGLAIDLPLEKTGNATDSSQKGIFECTDPHTFKWSSAKEIWLDGIFSRDWAWSFNKLLKLDTLNHTISLAYNEKYDLTNKNTFFFACNLLEEIDIPGEYYIDREQEKLYLYPPDNFNTSTDCIQISYNPNDLIAISNTNNIQFKNIQFELGRGKAISISNGSNTIFSNCSFKNFGSSAISINGKNNSVQNCIIHAIGGAAITLNGGNPDSLIPSNNRVVNCSISDWAFYNRVYAPAIALYGVGNIVSQNHIYDAPHGAITISGNNHIIEKNEIHDVLEEFRDFGAIYGFLGKNQQMRGHIIKENYFHDIGQIGDGVYAIYADEATGGWTITDNIFYKIGNKGARNAAILGNTSSYINIVNNIFIDCSETFELSFHFSTWGKKRYQDYFLKSWIENDKNKHPFSEIHLMNYPELKNFLLEERVYVNTNSFKSNLIGSFTIPLNHSNYFKTQSDLLNADSLVNASNNRFIKDNSIPVFLNTLSVKQQANKPVIPIPENLKNFNYFINKTKQKSNKNY
ncbi:MAG: right-handed parallel beta-helix repeat-containing protein [Bacteroidetes bacterium]|nr:right-handed parallel beta-helix repeat-containing protein [Bacteroidota bacterium]